jgi:hypothetical protein
MGPGLARVGIRFAQFLQRHVALRAAEITPDRSQLHQLQPDSSGSRATAALIEKLELPRDDATAHTFDIRTGREWSKVAA